MRDAPNQWQWGNQEGRQETRILLCFAICGRPGCESLRIISVPRWAPLHQPEPLGGWKRPGNVMEPPSWRAMPTRLAAEGGAVSVVELPPLEDKRIPRGQVICEAFAVTHSCLHSQSPQVPHAHVLRARHQGGTQCTPEGEEVSPTPEMLCAQATAVRPGGPRPGSGRASLGGESGWAGKPR